MSIPEEKMTLIDNRYQIKEKIASHYSSAGSKCSDYELAQYIIFYMQAAHMFEDEKKVQKEIEKFHREHNTEWNLYVRHDGKKHRSQKDHHRQLQFHHRGERRKT